MLPIASFLAGSLLSLLLPVLLLIALVAWYDLIFRRHEAAETSDLGRSGAEATGTGQSAGPGEGPGQPQPVRPPPDA